MKSQRRLPNLPYRSASSLRTPGIQMRPLRCDALPIGNLRYTTLRTLRFVLAAGRPGQCIGFVNGPAGWPLQTQIFSSAAHPPVTDSLVPTEGSASLP
jgi:hypothetical protein